MKQGMLQAALCLHCIRLYAGHITNVMHGHGIIVFSTILYFLSFSSNLPP